MLYKQQPDPSQIFRHHCRNVRCGAKLKVPVLNPRAAFCSKGCARQFYDRHCLVCEATITQKTKPRRTCSRSKCRHELQQTPGKFFSDCYPIASQTQSGKKRSARVVADAGQISSGNSIKTEVPSDAKSGRGWHQIAGPALSPDQARLATIGAEKAPRPRPASRPIFQRNNSPLNIIGGFKFPNALRINISAQDAEV